MVTNSDSEQWPRELRVGSILFPALHLSPPALLSVIRVSPILWLQTVMYPILKGCELLGTLYQQVICIFNASSITVVQVESQCGKPVFYPFSKNHRRPGPCSPIRDTSTLNGESLFYVVSSQTSLNYATSQALSVRPHPVTLPQLPPLCQADRPWDPPEGQDTRSFKSGEHMHTAVEPATQWPYLFTFRRNFCVCLRQAHIEGKEVL